MTGTVGILNVGAGDTKLSFDSSNPAETLRSGRIVRDMLRRGYALLVEVDRNGQKAFERALDFDETKSCYIIADFDPVTAALSDEHERTELEFDQAVMSRAKEREDLRGEEPVETAPPETSAPETPGKRGKYKRKEVPAGSTRAVAVGRSAGG